MKKLLIILSMLFVSGCASDKVVDSYIYLDLPGNATTGYTWEYEISDEDKVVLGSEEYETDTTEEGVVGSGGTTKYKFNVYESGKATLTFVYKRSWESEELYKLVYNLKIDEYLNVEVLSQSGEYFEDMPKLRFERVEE